MVTSAIRTSLLTGAITVCFGPCFAPVSAQEAAAEPAEPIAEACTTAEHRQFDFWVGHWLVVNPAGDTVGTNEIVRVAEGCGLREIWRSQSGGSGTSLNMYDPRSDRWNQVWVGGDGLILHLTGGIEGRAMVMSGERTTSDGGTVLDRIRWIPLDGGAVRQLWEASTDAGQTWRTVFNGIYRRR